MHDRFMPVLKRVFPARWRLVPVVNGLLGDSITVAGLLSGGDILQAARKAPRADYYCIPRAALNADEIFLDGLTLEELKKSLAPADVVVAGDPAEAVMRILELST
jgi:hypothetical protein